MKKIDELVIEIKRLENELSQEIQKKETEYYYKIQGKRILFEESVKQVQKSLSSSLAAYIFHAPLLHTLSGVVIWSCLLPALILDIFVSIYQALCFPVYGIPKVKRKDYIVVDRHSLAYLNLIEKINCMYCGYFNGLVNYIQEVAARTEQYWCPIKHAYKIVDVHHRYANFLDYGNAENYQKNMAEARKELQKEK